jgi:ABC-type glycerol-3-phosphate transport system permease component
MSYKGVRAIKKRRRRFRIKIKPSQVILYLFMIALAAFTMLPLVYLVSTAFKPMDELFYFPPRFFVERPVVQNFRDLMTSLGGTTVPFLRYVFNSVFITVATVVLTVIISAMCAYGVSKLKPVGSNILFALCVAALMFSGHVTQIPRYLVVNGMGLIDSYWALILPNIAVGYSMFLMKQFMDQFPKEILEAARIDGASEVRIFWNVVMPSMKPAWGTLVVLTTVATWNDYFSPLVYTSSQTMRTLPLALQTIAGGPAHANIGRAGAVAAAAFLMVVPVIILYAVMQRKMIATMVHSGIKS